MKFRTQKITALMASAIVGVSTLGSVSVMAAESTEAMADQAGMVVDRDAIAADGDAIPSDFIQGTFKPSETTVQAQDSYEYPFIGLNMKLPEELLKQIKAQTIAMITNEIWNDNADAIKYAYISWSEMTEEQKEAEVDKMGTAYDDWYNSLAKIGAIGIYDEDSEKELDKITGCTEHKEIGSSSDGKYKYYLSTNKDADKSLKKEVEEIDVTLTEMTPFQHHFAFDQLQETSNEGDSTTVGKFKTKGVDGKDYTEKVFSDYDLTLVNVFTTWCSPCVNEIPELEKLYEEMKEKSVGVVGVVLDTVGDDAKQNEDTVKKAGVLQEKTKASYPFLVPDSTMMNGRLNGVSAFPETFFVDKEGNIVGETYSGSHTLDEWKEIVEKELKNISK
ncbi:TlpA family protein disulfide reductase [Anthropogastromicrobium aceti]|uniref:TlpA family protein disulfide reductase n=1 Tax=Anthropogastromicrobium aceti TaxID=2981768 RepID=A0AAE3JDG6_9FIRM|nr:TlpA disulfide reductase family protein [Anthropogastromicrobium aceti]MCC2222986.1 TlpA family protein disulfide reductase [Anthropogastromicrobium aceti]